MGNTSRIEPDYEYIVAGAGAAGLSLLVRMVKSGKFTKKRILLVDKELKNQNDRTWCFWEKGDGFFEEIVFRSWHQLQFCSNDFSRLIPIDPYRYKMIRGIDFYKYCFDIIDRQTNIEVRYGLISEIHSDGAGTWLMIDGVRYSAGYIFNSAFFKRNDPQKKQIDLLQHFKGWVIETAHPFFDEKIATLMDFRVSQEKGTTFVYTMPFSPKQALVEYTMFSKGLLPQEAYDEALRQYIDRYIGCSDYTVSSVEFGSIPMTNYRFTRQRGNILQLGTAGGQTKASSGYTFQFIQKHTAALATLLAEGGEITNPSLYAPRFHFYDSVLLNVLATNKLSGERVFTRLFSRNPVGRIFEFLDNDSSLLSDLRLVSTLPTIPFLKAAIEQLH